jgi:pilus assembly protein CpaB
MLRRRWPVASKALVVLAGAFGASAFLLVRGYEARLEALRPAVGPPVPVVVATQDLARGSTVDETMVLAEPMPATFVPPGAMHAVADAVGRVLVADIAEGEAVTASRIATRQAGPIAALVAPGLRAVVVPVSLPSATLRAGDLVDVLATYGGQRAHTETVAPGVEVLRVLVTEGGGITGGATDAGPQLVLLVSPDVAERIAYARAFAQLSVAILGTDPGATTLAFDGPRIPGG